MYFCFETTWQSISIIKCRLSSNSMKQYTLHLEHLHQTWQGTYQRHPGIKVTCAAKKKIPPTAAKSETYIIAHTMGANPP